MRTGVHVCVCVYGHWCWVGYSEAQYEAGRGAVQQLVRVVRVSVYSGGVEALGWGASG